MVSDEPKELFNEFKELSDKWMAWGQGFQEGMNASRSFRETGEFRAAENPYQSELMEFLNKHNRQGEA